MRRPFTFSLIAVFAAAGAALSGYLSYVNLWGSGCEQTAITCGSTGPVMIFGIPNCVYGFGMFFAVLLFAIGSMVSEKAKMLPNLIFWLSVVGMLFALGLVIYEYGWLKEKGIPACMYGFIFYLIIFVLAFVYRHQERRAIQPPPQS